MAAKEILDFDKLFDANNFSDAAMAWKHEAIVENFGWGSRAFWRLCVVFLLAWSVMNMAKSFADDSIFIDEISCPHNPHRYFAVKFFLFPYIVSLYDLKLCVRNNRKRQLILFLQFFMGGNRIFTDSQYDSTFFRKPKV